MLTYYHENKDSFLVTALTGLSYYPTEISTVAINFKKPESKCLILRFPSSIIEKPLLIKKGFPHVDQIILGNHAKKLGKITILLMKYIFFFLKNLANTRRLQEKLT